jgi:hypothetical protein
MRPTGISIVYAGLVWALGAAAVLAINAANNAWWSAEVGYLLAALTIFVAWRATDLLLTQFGRRVPFRPATEPENGTLWRFPSGER